MAVGDGDAASILALLAQVQGVLDLAELRVALLDALVEVVPSDWASLNDLGADPATAVVLVRPALTARQQAVFAEHATDNPLLARWLRTRDGRAYRFSDVSTAEERERLPLFQLFYAPLGLRHQIAFTLPSARDRVLAVALSRREHDYGDAERALLDAARPFLIQCYRNALAYWDATAGESGGAVVALRASGLTEREAEAMALVARGASNPAVAAQLGISPRTVQKHLERAFAKLGVHTRSDASDRVWALARGR